MNFKTLSIMLALCLALNCLKYGDRFKSQKDSAELCLEFGNQDGEASNGTSGLQYTKTVGAIDEIPFVSIISGKIAALKGKDSIYWVYQLGLESKIGETFSVGSIGGDRDQYCETKEDQEIRTVVVYHEQYVKGIDFKYTATSGCFFGEVNPRMPHVELHIPPGKRLVGFKGTTGRDVADSDVKYPVIKSIALIYH